MVRSLGSVNIGGWLLWLVTLESPHPPEEFSDSLPRRILKVRELPVGLYSLFEGFRNSVTEHPYFMLLAIPSEKRRLYAVRRRLRDGRLLQGVIRNLSDQLVLSA